MNFSFSNVWSYLPAPMQEKLNGYIEGFWSILPNLVFAIVFLVCVWLFAKFVGWVLPKAMRRAHLRSALVQVGRMVAVAGVWVQNSCCGRCWRHRHCLCSERHA